MNQRGKIFFVTGGIILVLAGVFVGGFLVLKSKTGQGELWGENIDSENALEQSSAQALIKELNNANNSYAGDSLTQTFLNSLKNQIATQELSLDKFKNNSADYETMFLFLEQAREKIFPEIKDEDINIKSLSDPIEYINSAKVYYLMFAGVWQKVIQINTTYGGAGDKISFNDMLLLLEEMDKEMRSIAVPTYYKDFHKKLLQLSTAMRVLVKNGIINNKQDPLLGIAAIITLNDIQSLGRDISTNLILMEKELSQN